VIDDDSEPLYKLLAQSKVLVGVYSSAIYEGLGLGIRTYLFNLPGIEHMEELIESQLVSVVSSVDDLVKKIQKTNVDTTKAEYFFKPNSLENISRAVEEIMERENIH